MPRVKLVFAISYISFNCQNHYFQVVHRELDVHYYAELSHSILRVLCRNIYINFDYKSTNFKCLHPNLKHTNVAHLTLNHINVFPLNNRACFSCWSIEIAKKLVVIQRYVTDR